MKYFILWHQKELYLYLPIIDLKYFLFRPKLIHQIGPRGELPRENEAAAQRPRTEEERDSAVSSG
jgi:hypothetical protein